MNTTLSRADELMSQGAFAEAHEFLKDLPSSDAAVLARKGRALSALGRDQEAMELLEQALKLDRNCAEALASRGAFYLRTRQFDLADQDLTRAVELAPEVGRFLCNRGMLRTNMGQTKEALSDLTAAFQQGFEHAIARIVKAQLLMNQGDFQDALDDIRIALAQGATEDSARELEGRCHEGLGSTDEAVLAFKQSLAANPEASKVWLRLMNIEFGTTSERIDNLLEEGLRVHPDSGAFLDLFRGMLEKRNGVQAAVSALQRAVYRQPDHVDLLVALGRSAREAGQHEVAIQLFDQAIQRDQNNYRALMSRAMTLDDPQALPYFERAATAGHDDTYTHYNFGSCLLRLGRFEEALNSLQRSIELDPECFPAFHERGMALDELSRFQEALEHYDRALELDPTSMDTWMNRGNTYRSLGQYEKSLEDYQHAVSLAPHEHLPRFNRALTLKDLARHREALQEMEQVLQLEPNFARGWYEVGSIHKVLKTGKDQEFYQKACELDATFLEHPYGMPRRGPVVGNPPAAKLRPPSETTALPNDDSGRLRFLIEHTSDCFKSVLPIFTRETLFSQTSEIGHLENLALAFSLSATYFACRRAGIDNWQALPELGSVLVEVADLFAHHPADADDEYRRTSMGAWVVAQLVETVTQDMIPDCSLIGKMVESAAIYAHEKLQGKQHDAGQVDWNQRHQEYQQKIDALGGDGLNYALDLDTGLYYWVRGNQTLALANMTVLGILGGDGSFLGGWACPQARGPSRPPIQMGLAGELHEIDQEQAWEVVTLCAERLSVDYIETRATGNVVMFLGLNDMRPPGDGEEFQGFPETRAGEDVCNRLSDLKERLLANDHSPADLSSVFRTYGESIQHSGRNMFRDTPVAVKLVETGERVNKLGDQLGKKKLFLLSRGKVPDDIQQACLKELDDLLTLWGASPNSDLVQLVGLWEQAADYLLQNPAVFGAQQTMLELLCQGRALEGYRARLIAGGTMLYCGLYGVPMQLAQDTPLISYFAAAAEFLEQNSGKHESHVLIVHWVLEEFVPGVGERQEFGSLIESFTGVLVAMAERLQES